MNMLKIARSRAIQRNKDNRDYDNTNSIFHPKRTTSYIDVRNLIESDIPGKNTYKNMDEKDILQDVCKNVTITY